MYVFFTDRLSQGRGRVRHHPPFGLPQVQQGQGFHLLRGLGDAAGEKALFFHGPLPSEGRLPGTGRGGPLQAAQQGHGESVFLLTGKAFYG